METSKELKDCIERIKENSNGSWEDMLNDLVDELQANPSWLFPDMGKALHPIDFAGHWRLYEEPYYESMDVLSSDDVGEIPASRNAKLAALSPVLLAENESLKQRVKELEEALTDLVQLKIWKEKQGKDEYYVRNVDKAWNAAKKVIASFSGSEHLQHD